MKKSYLVKLLTLVLVLGIVFTSVPGARAEHTSLLDTNIKILTPTAGLKLIAGSSYDITWEATGSINSVNIMYSSDGGSSWVSQDVLSGNPGTYTWTVPSTTTTQGKLKIEVNRTEFLGFPPMPVSNYYYNDSAAFSILQMITPILSKPAVPADLTVTAITSDTVSLSWQDQSANESGFFIHRKLENAAAYTSIGSVGANITSYQDTGLIPETTYNYVVTAYNSVGSSAFSNAVTAATLGITPLAKPLAPTLLTAVAVSDERIDISWQNNSTNENGFYIYRKKEGEIAFSNIHDSGSPGWSGYSDSGLEPGTKYYYYVAAYNGMGSTDSNILGAVTTGTPAATNPPSSSQTTTVLRFYIDKSEYYINDIASAMDTAPIIKDSRTLLPIRYVATPLGASLDWDPAERKVSISNDTTLIELWIGQNTARVNGVAKLIDADNPEVVPIILPPGRTMLPLRFISENLGCQVDWNNALREAKVTYSK